MLAFAGSAQAKSVSPRIVNGSDAAIEDFPFQVALFESGSTPSTGQFCGGVVLDATTVITAAHCVFDVFSPGEVSDPSNVSVFAGSADLGAASPTVVGVDKISFDPAYDPETNVHDVARLTVTPALFTSPTAQIAPIGFISSSDFADLFIGPTDLLVSGWGNRAAQPISGGGGNDFPDQLQSAEVPLVQDTTCQDDYGAEGVPIDTTLLFCAGDGPPPITDSCQGDSGGPIVLPGTPPVLVGLVDSGLGCAQAGFPGIYTRLANADLQNFLTNDQPQAPRQSTTVTISGTPLPGQTLTCNPGGWSESPTFAFQFFRLAGSSSPVLADGQTYTVQESDRGTRIFCEVKAANAGGYGFGDSASVLVAGLAPPPAPPPPVVDSTAPKLKVQKKSCTKTRCTVRIKVTDAQPSSGLAPVRATLRWKQRTACPRKSKKRACFKTRKRVLRAKGGSNGVFTITANRLKPGTGYTITMVAADKAGNRPQFSTITNVRTKPAKRHRL